MQGLGICTSYCYLARLRSPWERICIWGSLIAHHVFLGFLDTLPTSCCLLHLLSFEARPYVCLEHRWRSGAKSGMGSYQLGIYQAKFSQGSAEDPGLIPRLPGFWFRAESLGLLSVVGNELPVWVLRASATCHSRLCTFWVSRLSLSNDGCFWLALLGQKEPYIPASCFGFLALMRKGKENLLSAARLDTPGHMGHHWVFVICPESHRERGNHLLQPIFKGPGEVMGRWMADSTF